MQDQNQQQMQIPEETRAFLEDLVQETGMMFIDDAQKERVLADLYVRLDNLLTARIVDNMPPDKLEEFIQMNEAGKSKEEIESFMTANIPDAQQVFRDAFVEFRSLYLGTMATAAAEPEGTSSQDTQDTDTSDQTDNPAS